RPRADDPERDAPDGDAEDEIPVAAPPHPPPPGQRDRRRDREQEHQAVHVDRERAEVDRAAVRRGDVREQGHRTEDSARTRSSLHVMPWSSQSRTLPASRVSTRWTRPKLNCHIRTCGPPWSHSPNSPRSTGWTLVAGLANFLNSTVWSPFSSLSRTGFPSARRTVEIIPGCA